MGNEILPIKRRTKYNEPIAANERPVVMSLSGSNRATAE